MTCEEIQRVFRSCPGKRRVWIYSYCDYEVEIQHNEVRDDDDIFMGDEYEDESQNMSFDNSWNQSTNFDFPTDRDIQQLGGMLGFLGAMLGAMGLDMEDGEEFQIPQSFEGQYDDYAPIPQENYYKSTEQPSSPPPPVAPHTYH